MVYGLYCVKDARSGWLTPTLDQNDRTAIRNFEAACKRTDSLFFTHAKDYSLYHIADFDNQTGAVCPLPTPSLLVGAEEFEEV